MAGLLSPESSFYRALNAASDLVIVNLLTILGCLPVVTAGASLTACARVTSEMVREEDSYIVRSWWASFRGNLAQSLAWWIPSSILLALGFAENWLLGGIRSPVATGMLTGLVLAGIAVIAGILSWLIPLVARFENTVTGHVSSAFFLAMAHLGRTTANLAIIAAPATLFLFVPGSRAAVVWFAVLIGAAFTGYMHALVEKAVFDRLLDAKGPRGKGKRTGR